MKGMIKIALYPALANNDHLKVNGLILSPDLNCDTNIKVVNTCLYSSGLKEQP